jgi:prepilin-type N-terminal cleavage/methylation domain-containing protein
MLKQAGFSLLELLIVLLALSLLLSGTAYILKQQSELQAIRKTDKLLKQVHDSLTGFAILENRLPCPASNEHGLEDPSLCDKQGYLPMASLAIDGRDAWGRVLRYRADENFTARIPSNLATKTNIRIRSQDNTVWSTANGSAVCTDKNGNIIQCSRIAAVFFSLGANGLADGRNGNNSSAIYAIYDYTDYVANDDRMLWLSINDLTGRMLRVGMSP